MPQLFFTVADPNRIESPWVRGDVYRTSALLTNVSFRLPSGRWVQPLATAPWPPDQDFTVPGHLRRLGGEFFCLPFGGGGNVRDPAPGWERMITGPFDAPLHGPCANDDWRVLDLRDDSLTLAIEPSETSPVRRVERRIVMNSTAARFDSHVSIAARRKARVPVAFHPILRMPERIGQMKVSAEFSQGFTYPCVIEPDRMAAEPGQIFRQLEDVPRRRGGRVDLGRLPLSDRTEDVVLLAAMNGPIAVNDNLGDYTIKIDWNRELLPHCLLWIHDRGNDDPPWNGQFRGLGIEPMAAAFDGPWELSAGRNPLNAAGYATSIDIDPDILVELSLSVTVSEY